MKRVFLFYLFFISFLSSYSQYHIISVGLRDNQYAHISYDKKILLGYEQSLLNVKPYEESGRLFAGLHNSYKQWEFVGAGYYGLEYNRGWYLFGSWLCSTYRYKYMLIGLTINPNYDSELDFQLNYRINGGIMIYNPHNINSRTKVLLTMSYGNIPEFRQNLRSLRLGVNFSSGDLIVHPEITVPGIEDVGGSKHIHVLCSFDWKLFVKSK